MMYVWVNGVQQRFPEGSPACTCGPDAPAEDCAYHGRAPYMVCEACNYDRHQCPGCATPLEHGAPGVCDGCWQDLMEVHA